MKIIPVIDLLGGDVVHADGGLREQYRPVVSTFSETCRPSDIAVGLAEFGFDQAYVADLDAIERRPPNTSAVAAINSVGIQIWLDSGLNNVGSLIAGVGDVVIGLETLDSLQEFDGVVERIGIDRIVLSLDHRDGQPITGISAWRNASIEKIAGEFVRRRIYRFIDLDLARVGSRRGPRSSDLLTELKAICPQAHVAIGGGVRNVADAHALAETGYDAALVATALYEGSITYAELRPFV